MVRSLIAGLAVLFVTTCAVHAEDIKGKVKSTDKGKNTIVLTVDDKDRTLTVASDAKVTRMVGKKIKKATKEDVPGGLGGLEAGIEVTVTTEKKESVDTVTSIKVEGLTPKKKKKKDL